jgi:phage terminase large subunit
MQVNHEIYNFVDTCAKKFVILQGGTSSGKTYCLIQHAFIKCISEPGIVFTVTGMDIPNLKKGALRDALTIYRNTPELRSQLQSYNQTDRTFNFYNGSILEFTSFEDEIDARGSRRDYLFINEANSVSYSIFWQLSIRTRRQVFLDYNPHCGFWVHDKLLGRDDVALQISNHTHNSFLTPEQHQEIESISDPEMYRVYALGFTGNLRGTVYKNWIPVSELPADYDFIIWGLDPAKGESKTAGYTAIIKIGVKEPRSLYLKEVCYIQGGMDEFTIKDVLVNNGWVNGDPVFCDHEPYLIAALRRNGITSTIPAIKGERSELQGIIKVKTFQCYYLPTDTNLNSERSRYRFMQVGDVVTNSIEETKTFHLMAALRMAVYTRFIGK